MPAPDALERSQKRLYRSLQNELRLHELNSGRDIRAYEKSYLASLPKKITPSSKAQLLASARKARVILVGDFHTFRQSQKGFLRLLEDIRKSNNRIAVALECVQQSKQEALDHYSAGYITLEELHDELEFEKEWPFPWNNYREILEYARSHGLPLIALNIVEKNRDPRMLKVRDAAAAEKIAALLLERPGLKVCALYGELHLGKAHIPAKLKDLLGRKSKVLVVHQNEPILYWKAPRLKEGQRAEVVKLRSDEFCVLNSVPWMKVRSYLDWIEGSLEEECSDGADLASSVEGYARLLQETLEIEPFGMSSLEILGAQSLDSGYAGKGLSKEERALRKHSLKFHRTTFLPLQRALLLPSTSTNALTEAGAIALWAEHSKKSPQKAAISGPRLTAQFLIGYLGSKILNPKRKCNEVKDMKNFLARRSPAGAYEKEKRKVIQRALWLLSAYIKPSPHGSVGPLPEILEIEATRLAGYVLGNRLFLALLKDASLLPSVRRIFTSSAATEEWAKHLLQEASRNIWEANPSPKAKSEAY